MKKFLIISALFLSGIFCSAQNSNHAQSIDTTALHKIDSLSSVIESLQKSYSLFLVRFELERLDMEIQRLGNVCSLEACDLRNDYHFDLEFFCLSKGLYEERLGLKDSLVKSWELYSNEYDYLNSYTFSSWKVVLGTDYTNLFMIRRLFEEIPLAINFCENRLNLYKAALDIYSNR